MQPVVRGHTADADMPATQNFLPNKRDHDGVINVVVYSVASRYSFESKLRSKAQHPRIDGLQYRVRSYIARSSRIKASITISVGLNIESALRFLPEAL